MRGAHAEDFDFGHARGDRFRVAKAVQHDIAAKLRQRFRGGETNAAREPVISADLPFNIAFPPFISENVARESGRTRGAIKGRGLPGTVPLLE